MEDIYDQILRQNVTKNDTISKHRIKTALNSFTYAYLDLDSKNFGIDQKRTKILRHLRSRCMILKLSKGQGIVIINKKDYFQSLDSLFNDKTELEILEEYPALRNLNTIQNYLKTLRKRGEITEDEKKLRRPKFGQIGRAHGLPKINKQFNNIPSFRPIVDTTNKPHYNVGKYLANLLNSLTQNNFVVKDSFEAVNKIHNIPSELFNCGYRYYSFDITSLFTNVPLSKTINIILERVYKHKLIHTKLRNNTLKKLLKDCCRKAAFSFNNIFYKEKDGVSMGSSLGSVLANIIMTELELKIN